MTNEKVYLNKIKAHRKRYRLNQQELGFLVGYKTPHNICKFESGASTNGILAALCLQVALNKPLNEIFYELSEEAKSKVASQISILLKDLDPNTDQDQVITKRVYLEALDKLIASNKLAV